MDPVAEPKCAAAPGRAWLKGYDTDGEEQGRTSDSGQGRRRSRRGIRTGYVKPARHPSGPT